MAGTDNREEGTPHVVYLDKLIIETLFGKDIMQDPFAATKEADVFEVDLSNVQEGFRIPPGQYPARLVSLEKKDSKAGNPMWVWDYEVTGPEQHRGFKIRNHTVLQPNALWKLNETMAALGLRPEDGQASFTKEDAINRKCVVELVDGEYESEKRSELKKVLPHPDGPNPVDSGDPF